MLGLPRPKYFVHSPANDSLLHAVRSINSQGSQGYLESCAKLPPVLLVKHRQKLHRMELQSFSEEATDTAGLSYQSSRQRFMLPLLAFS